MLFKRLYSFSFLLLVLVNVISGQQPKLILPIGHTTSVQSAILSPDGEKIITHSEGVVKLWDVKTGKLLYNLEGYLFSPEFNFDGKKILTVSSDTTVKIWNTASGTLLYTLGGHTREIRIARFSPDGQKIFTSSKDESIKIWDAITGKPLYTLRGFMYSVNKADFSPDSKQFLTIGTYDSTIKLWDTKTGKMIFEMGGASKYIRSASFGFDNKQIFSVSNDGLINIWSAVTGKLLNSLKNEKKLIEVKFAKLSSNRKKIITSHDNDIVIYNLTTLKQESRFSFGSGYLSDYMDSYDLSFDDSKLITLKGPEYSADVWDARTGKLIHTFTDEKRPLSLANFSRNGDKIITAYNDGRIKIWDASTNSLIRILEGRSTQLIDAKYSPDGTKICSIYEGDPSITQIWDASSGKLLYNLNCHKSLIKLVGFSPDGKKVLAISWKGDVLLWDILSGKLLYTLEPKKEGSIASAEFSPDGKSIITTSWDSIARIWETNTGRPLHILKTNLEYMSIGAFNPYGAKVFVTESLDSGAVFIFDSNNGNLLHKIYGNGNKVRNIFFSPEGGRFVIVYDNNSGQIWDIEKMIPLASLRNIGYRALFNPDGTQIISEGWDFSYNEEERTSSATDYVEFYNSFTGELIKKRYIKIGHRIKSIVFSSNGQQILLTSEDGNMQIRNSNNFSLVNSIQLGKGAELSDIDFIHNKFIVKNSSIYTVFSLETCEKLFSNISFDSSDYLLVDKYNHYDGTEAARKLLYFSCGTEIIELDQLKEQLWVPNLAERINNGETINAKTLDQLNICGLTPEVEDASSRTDEYCFKITPRRGGLGETVLYVNGIEARRYKPAELKKVAGVYELIIRKADLKNFFIAGKENPVTLKAYTSDNAISSRGIKINEDKTKEATTPPNLYAVMVGISDYKGDELDLKFAAKDATDISTALSSAAKKLLNTGDGKEHVFMYNLTTAKEHYQLPEKNSIKKVLEEIGKKATANDILLIFFAGHGVMEGDKKQFYFLTSDASKSSALDAIADVGISTGELTEWMKPQNIKAQKRILIFDACNSGQAIKDFVKLGKEDQGYLAARNDDKAQQIKAIDKLNEKSGLFILSASASNQDAYEMGRYSQGVLTYSLLKAIKQQPDILNEGKYLDVSRWFNAARETVSDLSKESGARQEPQIVSNTNFNIGVVDDEVMAKIVLPQEKPLFAASNFQNADENIMADDLGLNKLTDQQLNETATRGIDATISYMAAYNLPDAYSLTGRYTLTGNTIAMRVIIRKNSEVKHRFELTGAKDKLNDLAKSIVAQAAEWAALNK